MTNFLLRAALAALLLAAAPAAFAQTGVRIGTGAPLPPDASSALDVNSSNKGFLPPRLNQTQRDGIGSPAAGLTIYNTTSNALNVWNGTAWTEALNAPAPAAASAAVNFPYTGGTQTYTVPAGVVTLLVDAVGGQGGGCSGSGPYPANGRGGRVQATLGVTPGEVLTITVGGLGGTRATSGGSTPAGYNGGGLGWNASGGGGGATDIRRGGTALANRVLVAGGGGGQGENDPYGITYGGHGGGLNGGTGGSSFTSCRGGTGGSQTGGGHSSGALGLGGEGANPGAGRYGGGGGGGGYYGGGGGYYGGVSGPGAYGGAGGGGSSWTALGGVANVVHTQGHSTGNGYLTITPGGPYAAPVLNGSNIVGLSAANFSGALPVAALGFVPQAGGVVFTDAVGFVQNSPQLFWDNSTNRLGVGTAAPLSALSLSQVLSQNNTANQTIGELSFVGFGRPRASAAILAQSPGYDDLSHLILKTSAGVAGAVERVRITSDGNVGIGLTDPQALLDVNGSTRLRGLAGTGSRMVTADLNGTLATTALPTADNLGNHTATQNLNVPSAYDLLLRDSNHGLGWYGSGKLWNGFSPDGPVLYGYEGGALGTNRLGSRNMALYWNYLGRVGIGTVTPLSTLSLSNVTSVNNTPGQVIGELSFVGFGRANASASIRAESPGYDDVSHLIFKTSPNGGGAVERMRIEDGGNVGIGTTDPAYTLDVAGSMNIASGGNQQLTITSTSGDPNGVIGLNIPASGACPSCSEFILFNRAGTGTIGSIVANGNAVLYNTTSDKRLKEHISRTRFGLKDLMQVQVKDYNFIGNANRVTGFLAQDLFQIYPDAVKEGDHGPTVTNQWAVDYGRITPLLVQAIQDQQVEIEGLRTRAATAETRAAAAEAALATQAAHTTADLLSLAERLRALEAGGGQARR